MSNAQPQRPELYYESRNGKYWVKLPTGLYLEQDRSDVKLRLKRAGIDDERDTSACNPVELHILDVQDNHHVNYAGSLAGRRIGLHDCGGFRVLVTREPAGVYDPVKPGDCDAWIKFFAELLPAGQADYLYAWLRVRLRTLREGYWQPGPAVVFAGRSSCGKSFAQWLVTMVLGGRSASPMRYLSGQTPFNQDLSEAEHWAVEDERADMNHAARRDFGNALKQATVNELVSVHGKGLKAIQLPVWRCVTLSLNDEPEDAAILPPLTDAILNKLMIFRCGTATLSEDRNVNQKLFLGQLAAFRAFLLKTKTGKALRTREDEWKRFGHDTYHHPEIVEMVNGLSAEEQLLDMVDEVLFAARDTKGETLDVWNGKSQQLQSELLKSPEYRSQVGAILKHSNTCGRYLSLLARRYPQRVQSYRSDGHVKWRISAQRKGEA